MLPNLPTFLNNSNSNISSLIDYHKSHINNQNLLKPKISHAILSKVLINNKNIQKK